MRATLLHRSRAAIDRSGSASSIIERRWAHGFIAATGLAVLFLVAFGVRRGELWAWVGAVAAPVLGLAVALPAHYPNGFDTLGHLGLIYLAVVIFVVGALVALRGIVVSRTA